MVDPYRTNQDIAATLTAPIAAAWPRLTEAERELVAWLVRCQLSAFRALPEESPNSVNK